MSSPSFLHTKNPCFDPPKPNSEHENPKIDRWICSASASNGCNLDMCTETLGFENGAMCFDYETETDAERRKKRSPEKQRRYAATVFPPPLTTLRGEGKMLLRRKKEEGRVLLIGFRPLVVEAERSEGRLVLRMPVRGGLEERGERGREEEEEGERGEKEELVLSYGCGGKYSSVNAMFCSDAFWLAA